MDSHFQPFQPLRELGKFNQGGGKKDRTVTLRLIPFPCRVGPAGIRCRR